MVNIKILAKMEHLQKAISFIQESGEALNFNKKQRYNLVLAAEELLVNIINYAYSDKEGEIEIICEILSDKNGLEVKFIDGGIPFNPLSLEGPDTELPVEEREIGGLGVFLVIKTMDSVEYQRENGKNILTIRLYVG